LRSNNCEPRFLASISRALGWDCPWGVGAEHASVPTRRGQNGSAPYRPRRNGPKRFPDSVTHLGAIIAANQSSFWIVVPAIALRPAPLIPIGLGAVIRVDFGAPGAVSHVRPVLLVETGSGLEQFLVDVQNEPMFDRVDLKGTPWNGK